jgi:hypothetical protein
MKPWKVALLIVFALAVAAAGYASILVRRGFSSLATPSAVEEFAATAAREMAVPSEYRRFPRLASMGNCASAFTTPQMSPTSDDVNIWVSVPAAVSVFPGENYRAPRSWTERACRKLVCCNQVDKGGRYAAWEQPKLFSEEVRAGFRSLRKQS